MHTNSVSVSVNLIFLSSLIKLYTYNLVHYKTNNNFKLYLVRIKKKYLVSENIFYFIVNYKIRVYFILK